jgi:hypothetical protein
MPILERERIHPLAARRKVLKAAASFRARELSLAAGRVFLPEPLGVKGAR